MLIECQNNISAPAVSFFKHLARHSSQRRMENNITTDSDSDKFVGKLQELSKQASKEGLHQQESQKLEMEHLNSTAVPVTETLSEFATTPKQQTNRQTNRSSKSLLQTIPDIQPQPLNLKIVRSESPQNEVLPGQIHDTDTLEITNSVPQPTRLPPISQTKLIQPFQTTAQTESSTHIEPNSSDSSKPSIPLLPISTVEIQKDKQTSNVIGVEPFPALSVSPPIDSFQVPADLNRAWSTQGVAYLVIPSTDNGQPGHYIMPISPNSQSQNAISLQVQSPTVSLPSPAQAASALAPIMRANTLTPLGLSSPLNAGSLFVPTSTVPSFPGMSPLGMSPTFDQFKMPVSPSATLRSKPVLDSKKTYSKESDGQDARADVRFNLPVPTSVAVSPQGLFYISDQASSSVQVFTYDGSFLSAFGGHGNEHGQLNCPHGIALSPDCSVLYVCDLHNHRVQTFRSDGVPLLSFGRYGTKEGEFCCPYALAVSPSGTEVIVTDYYNHRVQMFNASDGRLIRCAGKKGSGPGEFICPTGVAIARNGEIFIADQGNNRILIFSSHLDYLRTIGIEGSDDGCLAAPSFIALSWDDRLFISDSGNSRLQVMNTNGTFIRRVGGSKSKNAAIKFSNPAGVTVTPQGVVYLCDIDKESVWGIHC